MSYSRQRVRKAGAYKDFDSRPMTHVPKLDLNARET